MKHLTALIIGLSTSCGSTNNGYDVQSTSAKNDLQDVKLSYKLTDGKDVDKLWNALKLPVTVLDRTYSTKDFKTSKPEATLYCQHTDKPPMVEPNRGFCEVTVAKEKNGLYFSDENSAKTLFDALNLEAPSRSGSVKSFKSSDGKLQIYCAYQNTPAVPFKYFCWIKID